MNPQVLTALSVLVGPAELRASAPLSVPSAVAVLAALDTPFRLTWFGLVALETATVGTTDLDGALDEELRTSLARSLLVRRDPDAPGEMSAAAVQDLLGVAERIVADDLVFGDAGSPGAADGDGDSDGAGGAGTAFDALAPLLGARQAALLSRPDCHVELDEEEDPPLLVVEGVDAYAGSVEAVASSIQPVNWPLCNDQFVSVDVIDGSFAEQPATTAADGTTTTSYTCRYVEHVRLMGLDPANPYRTRTVVTCLSATHWSTVDQSGRVIEVGMSYEFAPGGDGTVVVDEGEAVVSDIGNGRVEVRSSKHISFADPSCLTWLALGAVREMFCVAWNHMFDITVEACRQRLTPGAAKASVQQKSATHGDDRVRKPEHTPATSTPGGGGSGPGQGAAPPWLSQWIDDAAEYWDHAIGIMSRESIRLDERRSSSEPVTTQSAFYDALESWEANRGSLNEGLDLVVRLMSQRPREGERPSRPRVDDTELGDDLARQRTEFARSRARAYLGLGQRASAALETGTYRRADLVADTFDLWGMFARDVSSAWMLGLRSANRLADDTPVPTAPNRRQSVTVEVGGVADAGPLAVACTDLVAPVDPTTRRVGRIGAAEVELSPNPLTAGTKKVTVSVNRSSPAGTYSGTVLLYGEDPATPVAQVPVSITLDGDFERR